MAQPVGVRRRGAGVLCALGLLLAGCTAPEGAGAPTEPSTATSTATTGTTTASTATAAPVADAPLVPADGAYLGVYYGDRDPAETDAAIGRSPQVHLTYVGWKDEWATSAVVREDTEAGRVSLVNWEPFGVDLADVVAGRYDDMLTARARQVGQLDHPVLLDLAAEMNEEEGWGDHDPQLYVAAYRHVHDVFAPLDHGSAVWVWAPNNVDSDGAPPALEYYPGDAYVDWTGIDGYDWGTSRPGFAWESFAEVFGPMYDQLHTLGKPMIIAETAAAEEGGSKAAWVGDVVPALRERFPDVRAVVWFDVDKERDWRIRSSPAAEAAFREMAADPYLQAEVP